MTQLVLVPGGWLGGWVWRKVTPSLEESGFEVYPVTLTGMGERVHLASEDFGVETIVQDVLSVIRYNGLDEVTLVGHSFAGKVVAAVADRAPEEVASLLFLDAFRPQKGVREPQGSFNPSEFGPSEGWTIPFDAKILDVIGKDVQGADREWLLSMATPWPKKYASEPVTLSENYDSVECASIFCTGGGDPVDEILQGKWGKIHGPYEVIDSGHYPMITEPDELAKDILSLLG